VAPSSLCRVPSSASAARPARPPLGRARRCLPPPMRAGRVPKLALERIDGAAAISSPYAETLIELGFQSGPRRLTLSA
jgi:ATP-dependent Lhr-like helicase